MSDKAIPYKQDGKVACPNCGYKYNSFMEVGEDPHSPNVGDLGVCLECGDLHWFTAEGPQSLTYKEYYAVLAADETLRKVLKARNQVMGGNSDES